MSAQGLSDPGARVPGCLSPTPPPRPSARCSRTRWTRSAARSGRARSRWPRRSPTPWTSGQHLLVQAGTGTGKSLAYLVPSLLHDEPGRGRHRDPRAPAPAGRARHPARWSRRSATAVDASYAVLKGRSNYACLHRIREGVPDDQGTLVDVPDGSHGREGPRAARLGRGGGQGRRQRRARQRAAPHRPRVAPGQRQPPRLPRRRQVPVRRRSASPSWPARRRTAAT